jgi:L-threonylcarbamoyladenylate synthase
MAEQERRVAAAAAAIARGRIVAYPTETFYGLAVDSLDQAALARLRALKGRGAEKAFSVLVAERAMLGALCAEISPLAEELMARHWPGPLTLALPARSGLPGAIVLDGCVAVRISAHPLARALVAAAGRPITATSANPGGAAAPTTAAGVAAYFSARDCHILEGGPTPGGAPSTLARIRGDRIEVLRPGPVSLP